MWGEPGIFLTWGWHNWQMAKIQNKGAKSRVLFNSLPVQCLVCITFTLCYPDIKVTWYGTCCPFNGCHHPPLADSMFLVKVTLLSQLCIIDAILLAFLNWLSLSSFIFWTYILIHASVIIEFTLSVIRTIAEPAWLQLVEQLSSNLCTVCLNQVMRTWLC